MGSSLHFPAAARAEHAIALHPARHCPLRSRAGFTVAPLMRLYTSIGRLWADDPDDAYEGTGWNRVGVAGSDPAI